MNGFPQALQPLVEEYANIEIQRSTDVGNITAAPWIALFDRRLTISATGGYYIFYLFSVDLSSVTLSLAFGTTQFTKQFGGPSESFPRMRSAATRLQEMFNHPIPASMSRAGWFDYLTEDNGLSGDEIKKVYDADTDAAEVPNPVAELFANYAAARFDKVSAPISTTAGTVFDDWNEPAGAVLEKRYYVGNELQQRIQSSAGRE